MMQKAGEALCQGAVEGGNPLTIFIDDNDKIGAKAVTLKALGITLDGFEDDAKVRCAPSVCGVRVRPRTTGG